MPRKKSAAQPAAEAGQATATPAKRRPGRPKGSKNKPKVAATKGYGAEVVLHGNIWDEANEKAKELVRIEGLTYVHPFDDEQLIAGQGTLGMELLDQCHDVGTVLVPIGGGGLVSGVSAAFPVGEVAPGVPYPFCPRVGASSSASGVP